MNVHENTSIMQIFWVHCCHKAIIFLQNGLHPFHREVKCVRLVLIVWLNGSTTKFQSFWISLQAVLASWHAVINSPWNKWMRGYIWHDAQSGFCFYPQLITQHFSFSFKYSDSLRTKMPRVKCKTFCPEMEVHKPVINVPVTLFFLYCLQIWS